MVMFYKIVPATDWALACNVGVFLGSVVDLKDGFIHFSAAEQVVETAARHFHGQSGLLLVGFDTTDFGENLRWEASRGGALFPHLYEPLRTTLARTAAELAWDGTAHVFPSGFAA